MSNLDQALFQWTVERVWHVLIIEIFFFPPLMTKGMQVSMVSLWSNMKLASSTDLNSPGGVPLRWEQVRRQTLLTADTQWLRTDTSRQICQLSVKYSRCGRTHTVVRQEQVDDDVIAPCRWKVTFLTRTIICHILLWFYITINHDLNINIRPIFMSGHLCSILIYKYMYINT